MRSQLRDLPDDKFLLLWTSRAACLNLWPCVAIVFGSRLVVIAFWLWAPKTPL
jgi:hypothetical protein